jgi:valyl-tRNA synthetase
MIMMGLEFTGTIPFETVYLHGLIRDENGKKMSKSYGNVIDPLNVMEELGTDALRFTLLVGSTPGNDMNLSLKRVEANRNFANKLWNAGRFVISTISNAPRQAQHAPDWTLADSWIWARLQSLVREVERLFNNFQYGEAGRQIYDFFWGEFADWYVEIAKLQIEEGGDRAFYTAQTLVRVLDLTLRLLHPFTPFVTEELWGHLKAAANDHSADFQPKGGWEQALILAHWPEARSEEGWESSRVADFNLIQEIVRSIRNLRSEKSVTPSRRIPAILISEGALEILQAEEKSIASLSGLDPAKLRILAQMESKPDGHVALVVGPVEVYLPLAGLVDIEEERQRLQADLLAGPFAQKAPEAVVQKEREKLAGYLETKQKLEGQLTLLD